MKCFHHPGAGGDPGQSGSRETSTGIMIAAAARWVSTTPTEVASLAPTRNGGTSDTAVSTRAMRRNVRADRAVQRRRAATMTRPTSEETNASWVGHHPHAQQRAQDAGHRDQLASKR
jgi:septal ring-binding cell division protein DamX